MHYKNVNRIYFICLVVFKDISNFLKRFLVLIVFKQNQIRIT